MTDPIKSKPRLRKSIHPDTERWARREARDAFQYCERAEHSLYAPMSAAKLARLVAAELRKLAQRK